MEFAFCTPIELPIHHVSVIVYPLIAVFVLLLILPARRSGRSDDLRNGSAEPITCPRCGNVNPPVARYCANCGRKLR